jgi:hypothetical protein
VAASFSSHTKGSRDSVTPNVTSGAMTGSTARKMHAKLARRSSIIMKVLQRNLGEQRGAAIPRNRSLMTARMVPIFLRVLSRSYAVHVPTHDARSFRM